MKSPRKPCSSAVGCFGLYIVPLTMVPGNSVRKSFYVADPETMYHKLVEEYVLISEEVWQMYAIRLMSRR